MWIKWEKGYFRDRVLNVKRLRGFWIISFTFFTSNVKVANILTIAHLLLGHWKSGKGGIWSKSHSILMHHQDLTLQETKALCTLPCWLENLIMGWLHCSIPLDRETLLILLLIQWPLSSEIFFFFTNEKCKKMDKKSTQERLGNLDSKKASGWMISLLCGTRAPLLLWKRFLANIESHGTFGWELEEEQWKSG